MAQKKDFVDETPQDRNAARSDGKEATRDGKIPSAKLDSHKNSIKTASEDPHHTEPLPLLQCLEHVDHGIALTDAEGRLRWCNPVLCGVYMREQTPERWQGRPWAEVFRPMVREAGQWAKITAAMNRLHRSPKGRVEIENVALDWGGPSLRRIDLVICDLSGAEPTALPGWSAWYFYDLTPYRKSEENLQALLRHSNDGIFIIDADCRLRVFNQACERITGYRAEEVLHRQVACNGIFACTDEVCELMHDDVACSKNNFCVMRIQAHTTQELSIRVRSGEQRWVEVGYTPVSDGEGRLSYVLGILRDVDHRHRLEEQLRLTQKLATLGELSSAMAHEIKNPLGIILSAAEIFNNPNRPVEEQRQAAEFIREEVKRLDERMKVFLNFSRPRPPEFKPQDIHRLLTQTMLAYETLARGGLRIEHEFAPDLPAVQIDADQMQQVFLNLLMNADQSMPEDGTIYIATRRRANQFIEIEVADEGPGLSEHDLRHIFEPFFSTKPKGTGLGLAIVLHIVNAHRGRIEARNRPGGGAAFIVTLPLTLTH